MEDVLRNLRSMAERKDDYSGIIFIFDTLKKMTDVINKKRSKELYLLLRSLSAKGMTIILLAHTNKYNDTEGKPIYEGTGDLRSDVDEMIYFIPEKHPDGSMTVSTDPDKKRGNFQPITFEIDPDRNVTQTDYVDVASKIKAEKISRKRELLSTTYPNSSSFLMVSFVGQAAWSSCKFQFEDESG